MSTTCQGASPANSALPAAARFVARISSEAPRITPKLVPYANPMAMMANTRGSFSGGNESCRIEYTAGAYADSPAPTPARAQKNCAKEFAKPHSAVITLQNVIPSPMMSRRLPRSASRAMGRPSSA